MSDSSETSPESDVDEEIMEATYRALCEYGYADLTVKRIAEEYGKSTAAIHYHYDTKDDLLAAFLDYLLDRFVDTVHGVDVTDPDERLDLLLDRLLLDHVDRRDFLVAMLEMRAQAPHNEQFDAQFEANEEYIRYMLRTVISDGIDRGAFADVDAEHAARSLMTIVDGARTRAALLDTEETLTDARQTADEYVTAVLKADR
ncbi:TetR family transcriptional regulator C-terminal domain-containing protein [Halobaculum sp. D14]|uniref:TetR family transcriptional regulator C-terminal domain-containing protein n=1 Tax=unclassified Halobaculum TaxID=2640896 RepID=UPI003EB8FB5C